MPVKVATEFAFRLIEVFSSRILSKEASSDISQITKIITKTSGTNFKIWSGNDDETFSIMALGGHGVVSVASNIVGLQISKMIGAFLDGNIELASKQHKHLLPIFEALFWVTNPILIKRALNISGFDVGGLRLPMIDSNQYYEKFSNLLSEYKMDILGAK